MYEYTLTNIHTGKDAYAFGYSFKNAMERAQLDPKDWRVEFCDYCD